MADAQFQVKSPSLEEVLAYQNSDVVYRFKKTYAITVEESQDIFEQVKKWLWLANHRRINGVKEGLNVDHPIVVLDEMWHNFVLFTREYTEFCHRFFGYYLHHAPATEHEETEHRARLKALPPAERREFHKEMKRAQYEYIYDVLGKDTFLKWYHEFPRRYSYRRLAELHLASLEHMTLIEPPANEDQESERAAAVPA